MIIHIYPSSRVGVTDVKPSCASALSTRFTLQVNGNDLPGTFLRIEKEAGEPGFYAAQALIRLESASSFRLSSSSAFTISSTSPDDTLATLIIHQVE